MSSDILFLSDNGIRSLVRSVADDFSSVGVPISEVIKDVIQTINTDSIRISTAIYYDNRYFLAVPTGSNNTNDTLIVYNTVLGAFEGTWSPRIMQFTLTNFNQAGTRAMFKKVNGVIEQYAGYKSPPGQCRPTTRMPGQTTNLMLEQKILILEIRLLPNMARISRSYLTTPSLATPISLFREMSTLEILAFSPG